jgi:uncharacterized membrane protein YfcA
MSKFARIVFACAGIWGVVVLTPLYFLFDVAGRAYPPPANYPHFFYGFISVAIAWQLAFFVIASNPVRFRLMMIPAIVEKLGYVAGTSMLYLKGRIPPADASTAVPDLLLCVLFVIAFATTPSSDAERARAR